MYSLNADITGVDARESKGCSAFAADDRDKGTIVAAVKVPAPCKKPRRLNVLFFFIIYSLA
jgi:hypothetical protein